MCIRDRRKHKTGKYAEDGNIEKTESKPTNNVQGKPKKDAYKPYQLPTNKNKPQFMETFTTTKIKKKK